MMLLASPLLMSTAFVVDEHHPGGILMSGDKAPGLIKLVKELFNSRMMR